MQGLARHLVRVSGHLASAREYISTPADCAAITEETGCTAGFQSCLDPLRVLCHEYRRSKRRCATIREMKEGLRGRQSGVGLKPPHRLLSLVRWPIACAMQHGVLQWVILGSRP